MASPVSASEFRQAMSGFASGVTVVTTRSEGGTPYGLTATAFSSVCKDPPTCLVSVGHYAEALPVILRVRAFAVNILSAGQQPVSATFATSGADKFASIGWQPGPVFGCPLLAEALVAFECGLSDRKTVGDHEILFGIIHSVRFSDDRPLLYYHGQYADLETRQK